jgi:hypothetical protein
MLIMAPAWRRRRRRCCCGIDLHASKVEVCVLDDHRATSSCTATYKIGRAVYWMIKRQQPCDARKFCKSSLPKGVRTMAGEWKCFEVNHTGAPT